jgi:DNA-directed RNA polymerase specialized sigma24 family protein
MNAISFAPSASTRAAHSALYRRHASALRELALSLLGCKADAEDAVQDAFTTAWSIAVERPGLPPPPLSWLQAEVRRVAGEMRRRRAFERPAPIRPW